MEPGTPQELVDAANAGRLPECHELDFKRQLNDGESANKELAKDLASFAIDGGELIIGVGEDSATGRFALCPVAFDGLKERVDQVARSRIRPPLAIHCRELPSSDGHGVLKVKVPASPMAPHMVDGRYWGRNDTTKYSLSDHEVRRILEGREQQKQLLEGILEREIERDPTSMSHRKNAHLFVVAAPIFGHPQLLQDALGDDWRSWIHEEIQSGLPLAQLAESFSPDLRGKAGAISRRADGWAMHSYEMGEDRVPRSTRDGGDINESNLLDVEIHEDGSIHLFCGRASDFRGETRFFLTVVSAGLVLRTVRIAVTVANVAGYVGPWLLGVAMTNTFGIAAYSGLPWSTAQPYSGHEYRAVREFDRDHLNDEYAATDRLLGKFWRGLNSDYTTAQLAPSPR